MLGSWKTRKMGMLRSTELSPKYNCLFNMFSKCDHGPVKKIKEPPLFKKSQLSLSYRSGFVWHLCGRSLIWWLKMSKKNAIAVPLRMHIFFFIYPSEKLEECCRMKPKQSCCMASPTTVKIRACHNLCNRNGCKVASPQSWTSKDHKDALGGWRS